MSKNEIKSANAQDVQKKNVVSEKAITDLQKNYVNFT
jgi:hypothetical protein